MRCHFHPAFDGAKLAVKKSGAGRAAVPSKKPFTSAGMYPDIGLDQPKSRSLRPGLHGLINGVVAASPHHVRGGEQAEARRLGDQLADSARNLDWALRFVGDDKDFALSLAQIVGYEPVQRFVVMVGPNDDHLRQAVSFRKVGHPLPSL